jgi:hypothetical protein
LRDCLLDLAEFGLILVGAEEKAQGAADRAVGAVAGEGAEGLIDALDLRAVVRRRHDHQAMGSTVAPWTGSL